MTNAPLQLTPHAQVFGIGTDICDIRRIQAALSTYGARFAKRILTPTELTTWEQRLAASERRAASFVATRFAAKEAFSKAIGLGLRAPMSWHLCEITNQPSGAPCIVLHGALKQWFENHAFKAHITLSDERYFAVAFALVEHIPNLSRPHTFSACVAP